MVILLFVGRGARHGRRAELSFVKHLIDLGEAGPGVPEGFLQTAELATVETAEVLGGFAAQLARLDGEVRELALPELGR